MEIIKDIKKKIVKVNENEYIIPKSLREGMNVDAKIFMNSKLLKNVEPEALQQLTNVAMLPGIEEPALGMPDMHWGYGQPVGTVSAFNEDYGVVSAGMVGFDINCGINLLRTNLYYNDIKNKQKELLDLMFKKIPVGVGRKSNLRLNEKKLKEALEGGAKWAVENGYGIEKDWKNMEEEGSMDFADTSNVSELALKRGMPQFGTLGAGNHFIEIQKVDNVFDEKSAKKMKLEKNQIVIMIHTGSRGLGHQIATDYLKVHADVVKREKITLPDQQLVCAPIKTKEAQNYLSAMRCAVNYSFANKIIISHWIRQAFSEVFKKDWEDLGMNTVYGIAHNICKIEKHKVNNKIKKLYVHRKGATRSFPNTPAIIAGSMGTASYVLEGTEKAMETSFGSTCHGSGRVMSRNAAISKYGDKDVQKELLKQGVIAKAGSVKGLAEEHPQAYKNVDDVIDTVSDAGISKKVTRMIPLSVIKG